MRCLIALARLPALWVFTIAACLAISLVGFGQDAAPDGHSATGRDIHVGFEADEPGWIDEGGDVNRIVRFHDRTASSAHSGRRCERIGITATGGTFLYYGYPIGRAPVAEDLKISVWVKSERPGIQLLARAVFPRERDPNTLRLLSPLVAGSIYEQPGRWQRLELSRPDLAVERQARLLRLSLKRNVDAREAYVDRVLLNVYAGAGDTDVLVDDLEVAPIVFDGVRLAGAALQPPGEASGPTVEISQDRLLIESRPRMLRAIHAPGVSPETLKTYGFNVLAVGWPLDLGVLEAAATAEMWLMPRLPTAAADGPAPHASLAQMLGSFPFRESVLCWYLNRDAATGPLPQMAEAVQQVRTVLPRRPVAADVTVNFRAYSRELDIVGAHRWPIGTAMGIRQYRDWLTQRRYLARPGTYFFTWVQATNEVTDSNEPAIEGGPEPDQIRLLTYSALAAGCRGLGFWADRTLGAPGLGQQRLLQLGLLNLELQLLEPYFASAGSVTSVTVEAAPQIVKQGPAADPHQVRADFGRKRGVVGGFASLPKPDPKAKPAAVDDREEVQATLVRSDRGLVVIPIWYGKGAQFVPGQLAANDLSLVIPGIPDAAQAWQVTPAEIRMIKRERVSGGTRLTMPEFDLTAMVVLTSDTTLLYQLRREVEKTRPLAALWASELATAELDQIKHVIGRLEAMGRTQPDGPALLQAADEHLAGSRAALGKGDYATSYAEAQRAMRAVRLLQRAHWDDAVKNLSAPQASPYATRFTTLPEHWELMREVADGEFGPNLIAGGDFESAEMLAADGWTQRMSAADGLELKATLSAQDPHHGARSLHLLVKPGGADEPPAALDPTVAALVSKPIPVVEGDVIRIRFSLRIPATVRGSIEGAVVYDSIGGPALAISRTEPLEWKRYTLYRRVTRSDQLTVTLGLSGIGDMYVDDLEVQRMVSRGSIARGGNSPSARR